MSERKKKCALADKTEIVTFALDSAELSTVHRKGKIEGKRKENQRRDTLGPGTRGRNHPHT